MKKEKTKLKVEVNVGQKFLKNFFDAKTFNFKLSTLNLGSPKVNCQSGIAALLTIIIISAATLIMAYNASLLGLGELDMGYVSQKGAETLGIADGCVEEGFRRIRLDTAYSGENLTTRNGSCIINVSANGNVRDVIVTASTTGNYYKKIEANITLSADTIPLITVNSWEEKSD